MADARLPPPSVTRIGKWQFHPAGRNLDDTYFFDPDVERRLIKRSLSADRVQCRQYVYGQFVCALLYAPLRGTEGLQP